MCDEGGIKNRSWQCRKNQNKLAFWKIFNENFETEHHHVQETCNNCETDGDNLQSVS